MWHDAPRRIKTVQEKLPKDFGELIALSMDAVSARVDPAERRRRVVLL